jgi:hypothetical protein
VNETLAIQEEVALPGAFLLFIGDKRTVRLRA